MRGPSHPASNFHTLLRLAQKLNPPNPRRAPRRRRADELGCRNPEDEAGAAARAASIAGAAVRRIIERDVTRLCHNLARVRRRILAGGSPK